MRKLMIIAVAAAFLVTFTVPAIAAEWNFFGASMFRTFVADDDGESPGGMGGFDDTDLHWGRSVCTNFGASIQAGDIGGFMLWRPVEMGFTQIGDFSQFYGTWNFGAGTLLIGKALGPVNFFAANQVYLDEMCMVGFGGVFTYFKPQIQLQFAGDWGSLKLAAVEPQTSIRVIEVGGNPQMQSSVWNPWGSFYNKFGPEVTVSGYQDVDTTIPKLEIGYTYDYGPVHFAVFGGYQTYEEVNTANDEEYDIDSWIVGFGVKTNWGPFYVNGDLYMSQNAGTYQTEWHQAFDDPMWDANNDQLIDNDGWGGLIVAGFKLNDMLSFEAGYGYIEQEMDVAGPEQSDDLQVYYLQAVINVAKGFSIIPEIGVVDYKDWSIGQPNNPVDQGDTFYYGARWMITF